MSNISTEQLRERLDQWKTEFPQISDFNREIAKMNLVRLEGQDYMESLQSLYDSTPQMLTRMLDAALLFFKETLANRNCYNILSIGCGAGVFEVSFLNELVSKNKNVHFVGVDPNKEELLDIEEKLSRLGRQNRNFSFEIFNESLDSFLTDRRFDLIFCVHVSYYFPDLESALIKVGGFLGHDGKLIVINDALTALHVPTFCILAKLLRIPFWCSQDIEEIFDRCQIPFHKQSIADSIDISDCFDLQSEKGEKVLDFIIGIHTKHLLAHQRQMFLDYLCEISHSDPEGRIICPYSTDMLCSGKWD